MKHDHETRSPTVVQPKLPVLFCICPCRQKGRKVYTINIQTWHATNTLQLYHVVNLIYMIVYFSPMMTKPPSTSFSDADFFESLRSPRKLNMIILCQQQKFRLRQVFALCVWLQHTFQHVSFKDMIIYSQSATVWRLHLVFLKEDNQFELDY